MSNKILTTMNMVLTAAADNTLQAPLTTATKTLEHTLWMVFLSIAGILAMFWGASGIWIWWKLQHAEDPNEIEKNKKRFKYWLGSILVLVVILGVYSSIQGLIIAFIPNI
ncbi:Mbov_0395 family pilin-like conjugal transfer protein [Candidatus Mycoplasma pogonae]